VKLNLNETYSYTRKDFILDWYSGSGAGGQRRNKVQCCLRLTHIPSGITVGATEHAHRNANLRLAFQRLRPLLEKWIKEQLNTQTYPKNYDVIRTYNVVDNRVTDHASGQQFSWSEIEKDMDKLINARKSKI
jgi:peptide chain release factor 1